MSVGIMAPPFAAVSAFQAGASACDLTESGAMRLRCLRVDADSLDVLGITPALGRAITDEENRPRPAAGGAHFACAVAKPLWFPIRALPGKTMNLDGASTRIVGVLPANFEEPTLTEAGVLLALQPNEAREPGPAEGMGHREGRESEPSFISPKAIPNLAAPPAPNSRRG